VGLVVALTSASATPLALAQGPTGACGAVIDDRQQPLARVVTWVLRDRPRERSRLDEQCEAVGPIVLRDAPEALAPRWPDHLIIVGWNVQVGGGDVARLVQRLQSGAITGRPVSDFVLLLEEAHRAGGGVPALPRGVRVPRRIAPDLKGRSRDDIVTVARTLNLGLYYVPSMRNGAGPSFEDRGNAILSTHPLDDLLAIELPFGRQRRVSMGATMGGVDRAGRAWRLRLVTAHLDALGSARRLWTFATGWRTTQARALLDALGHAGASVLGADLNTWLFGSWEGAARLLDRAHPDTGPSVAPPAPAAAGRLDYVFLRLPAGWRARTWRPADPCGTGDAECGSDHRPIVTLLTAPG
jgi:endonuclease/exonuclease/phosphatase family metal-dependent hydrolase